MVLITNRLLGVLHLISWVDFACFPSALSLRIIIRASDAASRLCAPHFPGWCRVAITDCCIQRASEMASASSVCPGARQAAPQGQKYICVYCQAVSLFIREHLLSGLVIMWLSSTILVDFVLLYLNLFK